MNQCNLSGTQVASLMHSMTRNDNEPRDLEFHVSGNRLERGVSEVVDAIKANHAPTRLYLQMIEFTKEDYFRQLLEALRTNTTIRILDISKASLPYDAGKETCEALRLLFSENRTLTELDISGEQAHLEVTRFGIGLNHALTGLEHNDTLRVLRIEYQNLGLEGANSLSSVIEANQGLTHIYCEHNDINLQGFTTIVNALARNYSILVLPFCRDDQNTSMKRMNANIRDTRQTARNNAKNEHSVKGSVRRTLSSFGVSKPPKQEPTAQDVDIVVKLLTERWDHEVSRLTQFLARNNNISAGVPGWSIDEDNMVSEDLMRPTTALSDRGILEQVLSSTTPMAEAKNPIDESALNGKSVTARTESTNLIDENLIDSTTTGSANSHSDPSGKENIREPAGSISYHTPNVATLHSDVPRVPELRFPSDGNEKLFEFGAENEVFMME
jgi:hypothetical protein